LLDEEAKPSVIAGRVIGGQPDGWEDRRELTRGSRQKKRHLHSRDSAAPKDDALMETSNGKQKICDRRRSQHVHMLPVLKRRIRSGHGIRRQAGLSRPNNSL